MLLDFTTLPHYTPANLSDPRPPKLWPSEWIAELAPPCEPVARLTYHHFVACYNALCAHPQYHHSLGTLLYASPRTNDWCYSPIGITLVHIDLPLTAAHLADRALMPVGMHWATPRQMYWVIGLETLWARYVYTAQHPWLYTDAEVRQHKGQVDVWAGRAPNFTVDGQTYMLELSRNIEL